MNKTLKGYILGVVTASLLTGGAALAKSYSDYIEVTYDNIKVYKDNVLCELKDANGSVIEPFIYNGTTYMPVRGTAKLADMEVTWDGNTKSVYLWDDMVPSGTFLMEVALPYETDTCSTYLSSKGQSFEMAGEKYSNGINLWYSGSYALFNLNSKYSTIECTVGHSDYNQQEKAVSFIIDGRTVKEVELEPDAMPKKVSIPVSYGLQMKVVASGHGDIGVGNITVR